MSETPARVHKEISKGVRIQSQFEMFVETCISHAKLTLFQKKIAKLGFKHSIGLSVL